ncbi:MAG: FMN-binding protein [Planctomycetota bacterium]|jgi:Na+-transporting NADH:ubiquinone oxidoreductase subunit C
MKASLYTIFYAVSLGVVCAGLLTGVGKATRSRIEANEQVEKVVNILGVLDVPHDKAAGAEALIKLSEQVVREGTHKELVFHVYVKDGAAASVAFAFKGQGVWGPIEGFLALEPDIKTVRGLTFHKQEETPGLGGEIGASWFLDKFRGKSISAEDGTPGIRIKKGGGARGASEVDGISGATMTCDRVQDILAGVMARILAEREALLSAVEKLIGEGGGDAG